ncbi:MAG: hypothetical protein ABIN83_04240, partial [Sphingomicrobium sp.]
MMRMKLLIAGSAMALGTALTMATPASAQATCDVNGTFTPPIVIPFPPIVIPGSAAVGNGGATATAPGAFACGPLAD